MLQLILLALHAVADADLAACALCGRCSVTDGTGGVCEFALPCQL
jgi:hypothetical protein